MSDGAFLSLTFFSDTFFSDVLGYAIRITPLVIFSTLFNPMGGIPVLVRALLVLMFAAALGLAYGPLGELSIAVVISEISIGAVLLFWVELVFLPARVVGTLLSYQAGLSSASLFNPQLMMQELSLERLLHGTVIFGVMASELGSVMIEGLLASYTTIPIHSGWASVNYLMVLGWLGQLFNLGVIVALPIITALLLVDCITAFMVRSMPQFNVYFTFIPLKLLMVFLFLMLFADVIVGVLESTILDSVVAMFGQ